jgi:DNA (cytosine-5)-methyltransferase 1
MRYFSTFKGIGGFELGIHNAWLRYQDKRQTVQGSQIGDTEGRDKQLHQHGNERLSCVGYSEIDKYASSVYDHHFKGVKNYGDITQIDADKLPDFDCIVGGFPCQAFSIAGKRHGFEDTRGTLFFDLARILKAKQPRLFVFENVKGLLSHDNGNTFKTIISTIDELGYDCQWQVLNSKNHGVPQNRERVYIVGHLRGTSRPQVFPISESDREFTQVHPTLDANYYKGQSNQRKLITKQPISGQDESTTDANDTNRGSSYPKIRRLTPIECERLQGFPDDWTKFGHSWEMHEEIYKSYATGKPAKQWMNRIPISDTQRYKMCGNAVTTNVVQAVFERIFNV